MAVDTCKRQEWLISPSGKGSLIYPAVESEASKVGAEEGGGPEHPLPDGLWPGVVTAIPMPAGPCSPTQHSWSQQLGGHMLASQATKGTSFKRMVTSQP